MSSAQAQACNSYGLPPSLERGINLSQWMESLQAPPPPAAPALALRSRGVTAVRLPVNGALLMPQFSNLFVRMQFWAKLDQTLAQLRSAGFVIMLDMHPDQRFAALHRENPQQALQALKQLWREIAVRYLSYPDTVLFFELLNEPVVPSAQWRMQVEDLARFLRGYAAQRWFIVGTGDAQRIEALTQWQPLADPRIIYAVHFYDPMVFTHQGMNWEPDNPIRLLRNVPFPLDLSDADMQQVLVDLEHNGHGNFASALRSGLTAPWDEQTVRVLFNRLAAWQAQHHKPVMVNEFGVLWYHAPVEDRNQWLALVARESERICVGWTVWDFHQGFGIVDSAGGLDAATVDALLGVP